MVYGGYILTRMPDEAMRRAPGLECRPPFLKVRIPSGIMSHDIEGLGSVQTQAFRHSGRDSYCKELKRLGLNASPGS